MLYACRGAGSEANCLLEAYASHLATLASIILSALSMSQGWFSHLPDHGGVTPDQELALGNERDSVAA